MSTKIHIDLITTQPNSNYFKVPLNIGQISLLSRFSEPFFLSYVSVRSLYSTSWEAPGKGLGGSWVNTYSIHRQYILNTLLTHIYVGMIYLCI